MGVYITNFCKMSFVSAALCLVAGQVFAAQAPNPRSGVVVNTETAVSSVSPQRASGRDVVQVNNVATNATSARTATTERSSATVSRSATSRPSTTVSRSAAIPTTQNVVSSSRSATVARQGVVTSNSGATASRAATSRAASSNVVRSATSHSATSTARAASNLSVVGASRSSMARATAVFDDVSKIGGGYATCREAYATCMDQLCANANDTYRRCFCSSKFTEFRDIEAGLDQALQLLAQFEDNNLNAVDKTAEEVNAMYSATEGEMAIKNDTSGAAAMLAEIGDILSGKKTTETPTITGLIDVDFTSDLDDIWGDSGSSIFSDSSSGVDLASLEGQELYTEAQKQCLQLITDSCENDAVLSMAKSAYSILITQDCNAYEKKINAQKEQVEQTVRTAEKYLREARLEEYRSHNSADVNECIEKVKTAVTADVACGTNYKKCLDYTGVYIDQNGEPNYTPRFFELQNLITLDGGVGGGDVLAQNSEFNSFLDTRRMFAETALDTCRDMSDIVWEEFKRQALIEISQAQDEKIEEVKMSCVSTIAECYDTQGGQLKDVDDTTSQYAGAISAMAARNMCADKVVACASLYGDTQGCEFDGNGKLTKGNTSTGAGDSCGLTTLLGFVDTVDNVRIAEGCSTAIENYLKDTCTPSTGDEGYPWLCRTKDLGDFDDEPDAGITASLAANIKSFAMKNCTESNEWEEVPAEAKTGATTILEELKEQMFAVLMTKCSEVNGLWVTQDQAGDGEKVTAFYTAVYGGDTDKGTDFGACIENTVRTRCLDYNSSSGEEVATYNSATDECEFTDDWYENKCLSIGGYFEDSVCYVAK